RARQYYRAIHTRKSARHPRSTQITLPSKPQVCRSTQGEPLICRSRSTSMMSPSTPQRFRRSSSELQRTMAALPRKSPPAQTRKSARHPRSTQIELSSKPHVSPRKHGEPLCCFSSCTFQIRPSTAQRFICSSSDLQRMTTDLPIPPPPTHTRKSARHPRSTQTSSSSNPQLSPCVQGDPLCCASTRTLQTPPSTWQRRRRSSSDLQLITTDCPPPPPVPPHHHGRGAGARHRICIYSPPIPRLSMPGRRHAGHLGRLDHDHGRDHVRRDRPWDPARSTHKHGIRRGTRGPPTRRARRIPTFALECKETR